MVSCSRLLEEAMWLCECVVVWLRLPVAMVAGSLVRKLAGERWCEEERFAEEIEEFLSPLCLSPKPKSRGKKDAVPGHQRLFGVSFEGMATHRSKAC